MDDDERDRRKLAEIIKRMDERKLIKTSDANRGVVAGPVHPVKIPIVKAPKECDVRVGVIEKGAKEVTDPRDVIKKSDTARQDTPVVRATTAGAAQRDAARRWAASETSDTELVTQSTVNKSSSRHKGVKKVSDKAPEVMMEDAQALELQDFIASQYPTIDEGGLLYSTIGQGIGFRGVREAERRP